MNTYLMKCLSIALLGGVGLGVGTGCTSFWAASAPEPESKQQMEAAEPIEDDDEDANEDTNDDDTNAEEPDSASASDGTMGAATDSSATASGSTNTTGSTGSIGSPEKLTPLKMTVSATNATSTSADMYWDVAENTAMGTSELKLQLVAADSGAELKACREIEVSADSESFMGERVGVEIESRAERLTTYLPQDVLDKLAAANTVTVFVCEHKFLLNPSHQSQLSKLKKSVQSDADSSDTTTDSSVGGDIDAPSEDDGMDSEDSDGVGGSDMDY